MNRSRRSFLRLVAATTAAVAARPARSLASTVAPAPPPPAKGSSPAPGKRAAAAPPAALHAGIAQQQRDLAKALKTLRDHPLPPGSNPAFGFSVARMPRSRRTS